MTTPLYEFNGQPILVERFLILEERPFSPQDYDIFSLEQEQWVTDQITNGDCSSLPVFSDQTREYFSTFQYREDAKGKKYLFYVPLYSEKPAKIILSITCLRGKLWVNGKCLSVHAEDAPTQYFFTARLREGINDILLEQLPLKEDSRFSLLIKDYAYETQAHPDALSNITHVFPLNPLILIHDPYYLPDKEAFRFLYLKNDDAFQPRFRIELHPSRNGKPLRYSEDGYLNQLVTIPVTAFHHRRLKRLHHLWIGCFLIDREGREHPTGPCIILNNFEKAAASLRSDLEIRSKELPEPFSTHCAGRLKQEQDLPMEPSPYFKYWLNWHNDELRQEIKKGHLPSDLFHQPGAQEFFLHSELDDSIIRVPASIPKNCTDGRRFPVVLVLAAGADGWFSSWFPKELADQVLCFDVTGRGFTAGSYVGEASIMEIWEWIKQTYPVDENRVVVIGESSGGFAAYAFAQNHPSIPCALYPLIGYPHLETVENIAHLPVRQFVSPKDHIFTGRENEVKDRLEQYGNYIQFDLKEMIHNQVGQFLFHREILKELLRCTRDPFPAAVRYKTYRNRHLESCWVRLHRIAPGHRYAKLSATITDAHTLTLSLEGTDGVTVTVPPQIRREAFDLVINSQRLSFTDYKEKTICLVKQKKWKLSAREKARDLCKGTGLLDVYLKSLRIILPSRAGETLSQTARRLSRPCTNGYVPQISVSYPIYPADSVPDHIFAHSLILLDENEQNPYVRRWKDLLPVQYDREGYTYQNVRTKGSYVILQVIESPYDSSRSFLAVSTNDAALLNQHILLRRVILPSYKNGLHKFWNNEILVFDGKRYLAAYEKGSPLEQIR